jgi:hypothetical protein
MSITVRGKAPAFELLLAWKVNKLWPRISHMSAESLWDAFQTRRFRAMLLTVWVRDVDKQKRKSSSHAFYLNKSICSFKGNP